MYNILFSSVMCIFIGNFYCNDVIKLRDVRSRVVSELNDRPRMARMARSRAIIDTKPLGLMHPTSKCNSCSVGDRLNDPAGQWTLFLLDVSNLLIYLHLYYILNIYKYMCLPNWVIYHMKLVYMWLERLCSYKCWIHVVCLRVSGWEGRRSRRWICFRTYLSPVQGI